MCFFSGFVNKISLINNGKDLFSISTNTREISCLHGIKAISMLWIVGYHVVLAFADAPRIHYDAYREVPLYFKLYD